MCSVVHCTKMYMSYATFDTISGRQAAFGTSFGVKCGLLNAAKTSSVRRTAFRVRINWIRIQEFLVNPNPDQRLKKQEIKKITVEKMEFQFEKCKIIFPMPSTNGFKATREAPSPQRENLPLQKLKLTLKQTLNFMNSKKFKILTTIRPHIQKVLIYFLLAIEKVISWPSPFSTKGYPYKYCMYSTVA